MNLFLSLIAISCSSCSYVLESVKILLAQQSTKSKINVFLNWVCGYLGVYEPEFLRFCESSGGEIEVPLCPFCSYVMDRIKLKLNRNSTLDKFKSVSQAVCLTVSQWNDLCDQIVETDVPMLYHYLTDHFDSRLTCERLAFCLKNANEVYVQPTESLNPAMCLVCKPIVYAMKLFLEQKNTTHEIEQQLDRICDLFPAHSSECKFLVVEYVPKIVRLLTDNVDPQNVCELLRLCGPSDRTPLDTGEMIMPDPSE
ncbi:unnamed protein product [Echinostoma caproni]|uniref:Saposin B-type domain-containing protein n=1 Tax=Echinostoma caproni TaxID=27848 RepID=A0A183AFP4_9TREM|nr:unnamed protein product [Echinostoma caproni]